MKATREIAEKVVTAVNKGLCSGLGVRIPGLMCVEAAVCYAFDLPHGDVPPCVGQAVRSYKIRLNDANWASNTERANGMRRVAVAQLGSDKIDQAAFSREVLIGGIKKILPIILRSLAEISPKHKIALLGCATACEAVIGFNTAILVAKKAKALTLSVKTCRKYSTAAYAYAAAAAYAYAAAAAYADADADAYAYAYAYAAAYAARNKILRMAAEVGVQALQKLGSEGCEWLDLCGSYIP